jgi:hypothetical protein
MAVTGLISALVWWHASMGGRLLAHPLMSRDLWASRVRTLTAPAIFLLSVFLALLNSDLARFSWGLIALALIMQSLDKQPARK